MLVIQGLVSYTCIIYVCQMLMNWSCIDRIWINTELDLFFPACSLACSIKLASYIKWSYVYSYWATYIGYSNYYWSGIYSNPLCSLVYVRIYSNKLNPSHLINPLYRTKRKEDSFYFILFHFVSFHFHSGFYNMATLTMCHQYNHHVATKVLNKCKKRSVWSIWRWQCC